MRIVCFGEALIDFKSTGELAFQGYVGGSPLNVAVAASRLGIDVGFASRVSRDLFGARILTHMEREGIDTRFVERSEAPSTLAFVEERAGEAHFSFLSNGAADTLYDPRPRPQLPSETACIMFGSISLLAEPAATSIAESVRRHLDRCLVLFDPNVRPALIEDRNVYLSRLDEWLRACHVAKVSSQDLEWLYPGRSAKDVGAAWLERGPEAVVITHGPGGATLFRDGREPLHVEAPGVDTVDTVGAGDTFSGALMVGLTEASQGAPRGALGSLQDEAWEGALAFATAAAAVNCGRAGADPPRREELDRFAGGG